MLSAPPAASSEGGNSTSPLDAVRGVAKNQRETGNQPREGLASGAQSHWNIYLRTALAYLGAGGSRSYLFMMMVGLRGCGGSGLVRLTSRLRFALWRLEQGGGAGPCVYRYWHDFSLLLPSGRKRVGYVGELTIVGGTTARCSWNVDGASSAITQTPYRYEQIGQQRRPRPRMKPRPPQREHPARWSSSC